MKTVKGSYNRFLLTGNKPYPVIMVTLDDLILRWKTKPRQKRTVIEVRTATLEEQKTILSGLKGMEETLMTIDNLMPTGIKDTKINPLTAQYREVDFILSVACIFTIRITTLVPEKVLEKLKDHKKLYMYNDSSYIIA